MPEMQKQKMEYTEKIKYDCEYYYNLLKIQSNTAKLIADIRWNFVKEIDPKSVLDYGSGCGFFKAFAPKDILVDTYDIMPVPQTGITRDYYDLITFWDCLEHCDWDNAPDKDIKNILEKTFFVSATIPILPIGKDFAAWKHNKPEEHLYRFETMDAFIYFFKQYGFAFVKSSLCESPPREDIVSFLFKKI